MTVQENASKLHDAFVTQRRAIKNLGGCVQYPVNLLPNVELIGESTVTHKIDGDTITTEVQLISRHGAGASTPFIVKQSQL